MVFTPASHRAGRTLVGLALWLGGCSARVVLRTDSGVDAPVAPRSDAASDAADDTADDDVEAPCPAGYRDLGTTRDACPAAGAMPTPTSVAAALRAASPGDVVDTPGFDPATVPCAAFEVCEPLDAPVLVFSDSPESPSADGVLYRDTLPAGAYRVYVYHSNGGAAPRRFSLVARDPGATDVNLRVGHRGIGSVSANYVQTGVEAVAAYLSDTRSDPKRVPAGGAIVVSLDLDALVAPRDALVHGIFDLTTDGAIELSVVTVGASADTLAVAPTLSALPPDADHDRGTFPGADRRLVPRTALDAASIRRVPFGDGPVDPPLVGTDALTGARGTLRGNYGLRYEVDLTFAAAGTLAFAPRGGDWGAAVASGGAVTALGSTSASPQQLAVVGPTASSGEGSLVFLSAGGSSLPTDLVFAP